MFVHTHRETSGRHGLDALHKKVLWFSFVGLFSCSHKGRSERTLAEGTTPWSVHARWRIRPRGGHSVPGMQRNKTIKLYII